MTEAFAQRRKRIVKVMEASGGQGDIRTRR